MKQAFTIIELIFVIVVLGILSAVALPKFASTKHMADIANAKADVAAIRASIITERQSRLIQGDKSYIGKLSSDSTYLFTGDTSTEPKRELLTYGIVAGSTDTQDGKWTQVGNDGKKYQFYTDGKAVVFTYEPDTGLFKCDRDNATYGTICKQIVD